MGSEITMQDNKKKIAAMTAVLYYLQAEEEAAQYHGVPAGGPALPAPEGFWTFSGRQSQMMLRSMAQMRLFPAWRG
jgi:hypothetical protein